MELRDFQKVALSNLRCGSILCGDTGSGKSITAVAFYHVHCGGTIVGNDISVLEPDQKQKLVIITTARKRDSCEWDIELARFALSTTRDDISVDSWNNIQKYDDVTGAFFIFDEQRVTGKGPWVDAFIRICKNNFWILLSATPADKLYDYVPVFIANGFFKNRSQFNREHVIFDPYVNYPKIKGYIDEEYLRSLERKILVDMDFLRPTVQHHEDIICQYDIRKYKDVIKYRINPFTGEPIINASAYCQCLRKIVNTDTDRVERYSSLVRNMPMVVVFYNFDYELEILKNVKYAPGVKVLECNGHKHDDIPKDGVWVYLVQYNSGAEGWNCTYTNKMIFFSENYSYRMMKQASGRIDRLNTPFKDLYYYHFKTKSSIDLGISKCLEMKKQFNETRWAKF